MAVALGASLLTPFLLPVMRFVTRTLKEEANLENNIKEDIQILISTEMGIIGVLEAAEEVALSPSLNNTLADLQDQSYNAMDLIDEYNTKTIRQRLVHFTKVRNMPIVSTLNPKRVIKWHNFKHKLKDATGQMVRTTELNEIRQRISDVMDKDQHSYEETPLLPLIVVGREDDVKQIIKNLVPSNNQITPANVVVLAIYGIGGIGKTTLAQLLYNDPRVSNYFELKIWIHVSKSKFDIRKVISSIIESIDRSRVDGTTRQSLEDCLVEKLNGRRYLLVMDDFWHEDGNDWLILNRPLSKGAPGSKIIVTTRTKVVARTTGTNPLPVYRLTQLSEDECCSIVCQHVSNVDPNAKEDLNKLKKEIVKHCRGEPIKANRLGHKLRREHDKRKWKEIIEKEEQSPNESSRYCGVPSELKPCLAYCAIIPKSMQFNKEWVVQLWMAQNFLTRNDPNISIEDLGSEYFDSLVQKSFIQKERDDPNGDNHMYSIPDFIHGVNQSIWAKECFILEPGKNFTPNGSVRHLSCVSSTESISNTPEQSILNSPETLKKIYQCTGLYSLLIFRGFLDDHSLIELTRKLEKLRTLDLSECNLTNLPNSIGHLLHLRCLQLQKTRITKLPKSIGRLYNLQTLGLRNCNFLTKLPNEIANHLLELRCLDLHLDDDSLRVTPSQLKSMPRKIGRLTKLRILSRFVVSPSSHCGISELSNLNDLHGELIISNLDFVKNPNDATKASLESKGHIKRLGLQWNKGSKESSCEEEEKVLEALKPNTGIKELNIVGFGGMKFPTWLHSEYLSNLETLCLSNCSNCVELPHIGYLRKLRDLCIKGLDNLKIVNDTFCGSSRARFPSLKKLTFEYMKSLEKWSSHGTCELPCLIELVLKDCPNLQSVSHDLPSLTTLKIKRSPKFRGVRKYPSLKYFEVDASADEHGSNHQWIWSSWRTLSTLHSLTLSWLQIDKLPSGLSILNSLQRLEISHCDNLILIPDYWVPHCVTRLSIKHCSKIQTLPVGIQNLKSLEDLEITECKQLVSLPGLRKLNTLTGLAISGCHSLASLPRDGLPENLQFLGINNCPLLEKKCKNRDSLEWEMVSRVATFWINEKLEKVGGFHKGESSRQIDYDSDQ